MVSVTYERGFQDVSVNDIVVSLDGYRIVGIYSGVVIKANKGVLDIKARDPHGRVKDINVSRSFLTGEVREGTRLLIVERQKRVGIFRKETNYTLERIV